MNTGGLLSAAPLAVNAAAVLVALAVDQRWGEPPARWHPVVWMGHALTALGHHVAPLAGEATPQAGRGEKRSGAQQARTFAFGALAWCVLATLVLLVAAVGQWGVAQVVQGLARQPHPADLSYGVLMAGGVQALLLGLLLKPLFALRMLCDEVRAVEAALSQSLAAGRERLSWLVSRDVAQLTEAEVRESAIETLAENLNDSVVAPLFWFAVAGLPGAALYRLANTADAMWGYLGERHGRDWTWAGKWAARADDVLSWLPARLTAGWLLCVAKPARDGGDRAGVGAALADGARRRCLARLAHLPREARRTPSPNSGWPMAAMALTLGVRLGKPGAYVLNAAGRVPTGFDVFEAIKLAKKAITWHVCIALFASFVFGIFAIL